jgi:hypothetical protein
VNKSIKTLLLSGFLFAVAQTADAIPITYSVSGTTYELIKYPDSWELGSEVAITGSITFESESTNSRQWNVISGSLSIGAFDLHDVFGNIYFNTHGDGYLFDRTFRFEGQGADIVFNSGFGGPSFYNADGSPVQNGPAALDGPYSQLAPIIKLNELLVRGPKGEDGHRQPVYSGGQVWLTQVPIPASALLFGSALGLMGWMRRKVSR